MPSLHHNTTRQNVKRECAFAWEIPKRNSKLKRRNWRTTAATEIETQTIYRYLVDTSWISMIQPQRHGSNLHEFLTISTNFQMKYQHALVFRFACFDVQSNEEQEEGETHICVIVLCSLNRNSTHTATSYTQFLCLCKTRCCCCLNVEERHCTNYLNIYASQPQPQRQ